MDYFVKVNSGFGRKAEIPVIPISQVFGGRLIYIIFRVHQ